VDLVDRIKRIDALKKWHPKPEPPPKCPQCFTEFFPARHRVKIRDDDGEPTGDERTVIVSAKTRIQIHAWSFTTVCEDGTRTLGCKPSKEAAKAERDSWRG
jgi:hypothetical protein